MSGIFNPAIFNNSIFNTGEAVEAVKTGTGGIDKRRTIHKPTGLVERKKLTPVQRQIEEIVQNNSEIHAEVSERVFRDFKVPKPIEQMFPEEVDREIGILLRKKIEQEDEEMSLLLMIASHDDL